ncbi:nucleotidyltransferase domain-containing protein [Candidatus Tisiphia endosymbiont of Sialis lutaria]|uniref:nucleotidyltransferase domain-containing protein n=1 Tax=unclassified Candidatus Tisiphia TaxID=2996318 RepID=UPI00312C923C
MSNNVPNCSSIDYIAIYLKKYPYIFKAYGSRVKGRHRKFSDLDLCIMEAVSDQQLCKL